MTINLGLRRAVLAAGLGLGVMASAPAAATPQSPERVSALIRSLESVDGIERASASRELLRLGTSVLPDLEHAGARLMATVAPSRLDAVYTLIRGLPVRDIRSDAFGILSAPGATREDIVAMGTRHGFVLPPGVAFTPGTIPTCYVRLLPGYDLAATLRDVLTEEPLVVSVNLSQWDR